MQIFKGCEFCCLATYMVELPSTKFACFENLHVYGIMCIENFLKLECQNQLKYFEVASYNILRMNAVLQTSLE